MNRNKCIIFTLLALTLMLTPLLTGCGKKSWPEPQAEGEHFDFKNVKGAIVDSCLVIQSRIKGKKDNFAKLILELSEYDVDAECVDCPFHAQQRIDIPLDAPNLKISNKKLKLIHCDIKPGLVYRWRLVGYNSYPGLDPVVSRVRTTKISE